MSSSPPAEPVSIDAGPEGGDPEPRSTVAAGPRRWIDVDALRSALAPWLVGKLVSVIVVVLVVLGQASGPGHPTFAELRAPFAYWDGQNYTQIADSGYPPGPLDLVPGHPGHLWGFMPGYALLIRGLGYLGLDSTWSGMLISAVAELVALYYLVLVVAQERDRDAARYSAWLLATYPYAIFLSMVYTDSTFLAAATASLYYARRGSNGRACVAAAVAVAVRINGGVLIPVLAIEYLRRRRWRPGLGLLPIAATLVPLLLFYLYALAQTGDVLAYVHVQNSASYGSRTLGWPWSGAIKTWGYAFGGTQPTGFAYLEALELIFGFAGLVAVVVLWRRRRIPASLAAYATGVWLLPASLSYWEGMPHYEMQMMPAVALLLSDLTERRPAARTAVLALSAALMGYGAAVLASGRYFG